MGLCSGPDVGLFSKGEGLLSAGLGVRTSGEGPLSDLLSVCPGKHIAAVSPTVQSARKALLPIGFSSALGIEGII